jgi:hypothetical protein
MTCRHAGFKADVGGRDPFEKEAPASRFEHLVDLDTGSGFLICHYEYCIMGLESFLYNEKTVVLTTYNGLDSRRPHRVRFCPNP